MTPEPDCAEPTTTVLEALKRMNGNTKKPEKKERMCIHSLR
jgi:CBS domain-containing protein